MFTLVNNRRHKLEFNVHSYSRLLRTGYKYIELLGENNTQTPDNKKIFMLRPHKEKPINSPYYVLEIDEPEIVEMLKGSDLLQFYLVEYKE